jgi:hypothetical protein
MRLSRGFHAPRIGGALVIVALQVQHAVDDEMRAVRPEGLALCAGLAPQHRNAQHEVAGEGHGHHRTRTSGRWSRSRDLR